MSLIWQSSLLSWRCLDCTSLLCLLILASVRYELVKSFLGLVAIPALGSQLTTVVDGGRGPIRDYEWMDLS